MPVLHWKDEYSVGIEAVDYEHKQLIDLINQLGDQLNSTDSKSKVPGFFGELLRAISAHFALEEKFMRERGYSRLEPHKADHEQLLDDLHEIMDAVANAETIDAGRLSSQLDIWFSRHFRTHDAELHRSLGDPA
jgi:hemerythrin